MEVWNVTDPALIRRLEALANAYGTNTDDLKNKYDVWSLNAANTRPANPTLSLDDLANFEQHALRNKATLKEPNTDASAAALKKSAPRPLEPRPRFSKESATDLMSLAFAGAASATPAPKRLRPDPRSLASPAAVGPGVASPGSSFATRTDPGKVLVHLNAELGLATSAETPVAVELRDAHASGAADYMWERLEERARLMDEAVDALERELTHRHDGARAKGAADATTTTAAEAASAGPAAADAAAAAADPEPAAAEPASGTAAPAAAASDGSIPRVSAIISASPERATFVGRICCEGEGKLNPKSVFLEGSRRLSNGCRSRLDLSESQGYALFPGQVVALVGVNLLGHTILVERFLERAAVAHPTAAPPPPPSAPFNIITATGPFTCTDDLSYAPLDELLRQAKRRHAAAVVLLGPFIDDAHPKLGDNRSPAPFPTLFASRVLRKLEDFVEALGESAPQIVLVPSTRDAHHTPVFPQPPFAAEASHRIHFAPNPAQLNVGGVGLACCSADVLFALGASELALAPKDGAVRPDRMARLASHVLQQRLFMPLLPPPIDRERGPMPVDQVGNLRHGALYKTDILLMPSELAPFAKLVDGDTLCVNSGRLTRKQAGGNYAIIGVHPCARAAGEDIRDEVVDAESDGPKMAVEIARI